MEYRIRKFRARDAGPVENHPLRVVYVAEYRRGPKGEWHEYSGAVSRNPDACYSVLEAVATPEALAANYYGIVEGTPDK